MLSRYEFMMPSSVLDEEDQQQFPDISSCHYVGGKLTQIPTSHTITVNDMKKFWKMMYDEYGITYYDDLLFNINGVPYAGMLEPGSEILFIKLADLTGWITDKVLETPED